MKSLFLLLLFLGCGKPINVEKYDSYEKNALHQGVSEEILFDIKMSLNFLYLPLEGEVVRKEHFWSGDSWRLKNGAINLRWNSPDPSGFNYLSPTRRDAYTFPAHLMEQLSPAEKYDLYMGRYDYPLRWEVDTLARSGTEDWEGLCHGWAGASINHDEPEPKVLTNPDGVEIPFGSADIKALLSYAYSKILISEKDSLGKRCEEETESDEDRCDNDLSALSFHVVLTNKLGLRGQTVIADIDRYKEVWNHPIISYESKIEEMTSSPTGRTALIKTKFKYIDVINRHSWEKHPPIYSHMTVKYKLEIDKTGTIISGEWLSKNRPDFLWTISKAEKIEGYLNGVFDLIK